MNLYEKLAECQKVIGIVVARDQQGQVGSRKYAYAGLQSVLEKVVPVLRDRGLILVQRIVNNSLTVSIVDFESDGKEPEFIESVYPLPDTDDAQAFGSAITYGRRYSIVTMLGLVAGDDDDGAAATEASRERRKPRDPNADQHAAFVEKIGEKLVKAGMNDSAAQDHAEAMLTEWGVARDREVRPLIGDDVNNAWRDIVTAIDEGRWKPEQFAEYLAASAPF